MINESITIEDALRVLNEAVKADREAMQALIDARVLCNDKLGKHPTIQVGRMDGCLRVGILGLLNGLFGTAEDGWGAIAAVFDDDGTITEFKRIR